MTEEIMTPEYAYKIASQWGSFMSAGDPGACFYSFHSNDGRPVDETHRMACLRYTFALLECGPSGKDAMNLARLGSFFCATPLYGAPNAPVAVPFETVRQIRDALDYSGKFAHFETEARGSAHEHEFVASVVSRKIGDALNALEAAILGSAT